MAQNIKRVTVSVMKFAHEMCGRGHVTIEVCPMQVNLHLCSISANFDYRAFYLSNCTLKVLPKSRTGRVNS
jgi:hypothetical protein